MSLKDFLDYILFNSSKLSITVSDVLILILIIVFTKTIIELPKRIFSFPAAGCTYEEIN
jgi:hypothetical protein